MERRAGAVAVAPLAHGQAGAGRRGAQAVPRAAVEFAVAAELSLAAGQGQARWQLAPRVLLGTPAVVVVPARQAGGAAG
jgi:hypothetical protein